ncbi:MAG: hypothetical protein NXI24_23680 [bacterium]|nr:hypothetical protein [bacterium]
MFSNSNRLLQYFRPGGAGRAPMRTATIAVCFLTLLAGLSLLGAEELTRDGLKIKVVRAPEAAGVPGYTLFQVVAENPTKTDRTLHGVIRLTWKDTKQPDAPAKAEANCVAYLEIPAGHRLSEAVPCKGTEFASFAFEVKSVLPFVLDRSPLKWQKSEALK